MGIFNRSIPTYTVDTANKLRVTTPLPEEEPNTYVDDAFDPILNQAVRNRLLKQWGNPISATLAGYYEMLDNAFVGSTKQWGALGPGMGVLGTFGRTMDKGGDAIIGTLTEGVKGLTGQGVESPFHNIFVKDEDYTGGRLLAAMGNSMAKMANAPELTEEDFGGLWSVPSIGLELATDPGIMGGAMAKAGGAVGRLSTSEVLQNLGKSGRSPLADVGQLLSNYDDAMSKIALDVTAPGTRQAITKFRNFYHQKFQHASPENFVNRILNAKSPEEVKTIVEEAKSDPKFTKYMDVEKAIAEAKERAFIKLYNEKLSKHYTSKPKPQPDAAVVANAIQTPKQIQDSPPVFEVKLGDFTPSVKNTKPDMQRTFEKYVESLKQVSADYSKLAAVKDVRGVSDAEYVEMFKSETFRKPVPKSKVIIHTKQPGTASIKHTPEQFIQLSYEKLSDEAKLDWLVNNVKHFNNGSKSELLNKQTWFKSEVEKLIKNLQAKHPYKIKVLDYTGKNNSGLKPHTVNALNAMSKPDVVAELKSLNGYLTDKSRTSKVVLHPESKTIVPYRDVNTPLNNNVTTSFARTFMRNGNRDDVSLIKDLFSKSEDEIWDLIQKKRSEFKHRKEYLSTFKDSVSKNSKEYNYAVDYATEYLNTFPGKDDVSYAADETEAVSDALQAIIHSDYLSDSTVKGSRAYSKRVISNEEYGAENFMDIGVVEELKNWLDSGDFRNALTSNEAFNQLLEANPDKEDVIRLAKQISTVEGFEDWLSHLIPNTGAVNALKRIVNPHISAFTSAPITVSPSTIYNARDPAILKNAVAYSELELENVLREYGFLGDITDSKEVWDAFNNDPVIQQLFTPDYRVEQYVSDLKLMFEKQGLRLPLDNARLRSNFFEFINKYPNLKEALGVKNAFIADLKKVLFGDDGLKWVWDAKLNERVPKGNRKYTVQQQLLAVDRFTQHVLRTINPETLQNVSKGALPVKDIIDTYGLKAALNPELIFDRRVVNWNPTTKRWERVSNYNALRDSLALPDYEEGIEYTKNAVVSYLNGDFYSELYRVANDIQKNVFDPLKRVEHLDIATVDDGSRLTPNIASEVEAAGDMQYKGKTGKVATTAYWDKHEVSKLKSREQKELSDFSYIRDINHALRSHTFAKSISDVKQFVTPKLHEGPARTGKSAQDLRHLDLRYYMEVKFKNLGALTIEGSNVPKLIREYFSTYENMEYDKLPARFKTIRNYLNNATSDAERSVREGALKALSKSGPKDVIDDILKDRGGVTNDIKHIFNKTDLTPRYVRDVEYDYHRSLGDRLIAENEARIALEEIDPLDLVDAEVRTYIQTVGDDAYKAAGVDEIADEVDRMTDGKGPEHLSPEDKTALRDAYGDDVTDLFELIHRAQVSDYRAKFEKTNTRETRVGRKITEMSAELMKDTNSSANLKMYDAMQTAVHGDILNANRLMDELVTSGGILSTYFKKSETKAVADLSNQLTQYAERINKALGSEILKVGTLERGGSIEVRIYFNVENAKRVMKASYKTLKFSENESITFEAPRALLPEEIAFKNSEEFSKYDDFAKSLTVYQQDIYKRLGFNYGDEVHLKHSRAVREFKEGIGKEDEDAKLIAELRDLSQRLLNSDSFNHLYGTFGAVPMSRRFRGGNWRYDIGKEGMFDFSPDRVLSATLSEGVLSNTNVQSFVGLFINDNFKLNQYFETVEELEDVLYAKLDSGKMSGNLDNLDIIAPVYDESGKVIRFQRFDKTSRSSLEKALKTEDAILVPSHLVASLDVWCKKNAKMSSKLYRFFNKYFSIPYKFGVLANPGFLLGNFGDAYLKQATTLSEKYGTSVAEELALVAQSLKEIHYLNNSADAVYSKYLKFLDEHKIVIPPSERPITALNVNPKARKRLVDWLNGKVIVNGEEVKIEDFLKPEEYDSMRLWLYLNSNQPTKSFGEGWRDLSKEDIDTESTNLISRIFYGKGKDKFNWFDPRTWGLVLNNPVSKATLGASEMMEAYFRSANVLNALKHEGYDAAGLAKILGGGYDAEVAKKLHVDTVNAMNVMYNSNFNYEAQSELMDKLGYAIPFPTFFIKNFAYWMDLLVNNPEYIDSAITIQEGLWNDRDEEVAEDRFMAEAKGRGAVPISDGDERGLSKFFRGIYKPTPLNSMFSAFNLLNHPIENLTTRVHPLISTPMQLAQAKMGEHSVGLATPEDAEDVKYRPYSFNRFEKNVKSTDENFNALNFMFHKLNPYDRTIGNAMRFPDKLFDLDLQLADVMPSVFQPDF